MAGMRLLVMIWLANETRSGMGIVSLCNVMLDGWPIFASKTGMGKLSLCSAMPCSVAHEGEAGPGHAAANVPLIS